MTDTYSEYSIDYADVSALLDEMYRMSPVKQQFTRYSTLARYFNVRGTMFEGEAFHFKAYVAPGSGARMSDMATAAAGEFPRARDLTYQDLRVNFTDLKMIQASVKLSDIAKKRGSGKHSAYDIAQEAMNDVTEGFAERVSTAMHQDTHCRMAKVAAVYNEDGTTYTAGQVNAYLQLTDGSISQFHKEQVLDLLSGSTSTVRATVYVNDVYHNLDGPPGCTDYGPGITVTIATENADDANLNNVAADDYIVLSGESDADNFTGLPGWFSKTTNVYRDTDGNAIDRDAVGNQWSIPEILDFASGGSSVAFDLNTHMGELSDTLPHRVKSGGRRRKLDQAENAEKGIFWVNAMLGIAEPKIINDIVDSASDSRRFTTDLPSSMGAAQKKLMYGVIGWDGVVWNSPSLGPVLFEADEHCRPNKLELINPDSFFWLLMGEAGKLKVNWLDNQGSRFQRVVGTNNRLTFYTQAGAWTAAALVCDQPAANAEIAGIKSSRY